MMGKQEYLHEFVCFDSDFNSLKLSEVVDYADVRSRTHLSGYICVQNKSAEKKINCAGTAICAAPFDFYCFQFTHGCDILNANNCLMKRMHA